jgi:hypothetical protein
MSTHPGYADSDSDPEVDEDPTLVHDQPASQWAPPSRRTRHGDEPAVPLDSAMEDTTTMPVEEPTTTLGPTAPPVVPPPDLGAAGNSQAGLLTAAASDRCANCGAQLAPDQHYCVVCGERRGRARFASAMFGSQSLPAPEPEPLPAGGVVRASRYPPTATWIAGIAVLLVAMGLGILIGHDSSGSKTIAPQPKVNVTVNGGGGGSSAGSSTTASSTPSRSNSTSKSSTKATKTTTTTAPPVSAAQQAKSASAASKVLGSSSHNTPPPTVQQGQACTHGAGCQNGKFTGQFFGG